MTTQQLGDVLRQMYQDAEDGYAVTMIHLFGVSYANEIEASGVTASDVVRAAGINQSYVTEVQKGIRLAEFVTLKPEASKIALATHRV